MNFNLSGLDKSVLAQLTKKMVCVLMCHRVRLLGQSACKNDGTVLRISRWGAVIIPPLPFLTSQAFPA